MLEDVTEYLVRAYELSSATSLFSNQPQRGSGPTIR